MKFIARFKNWFRSRLSEILFGEDDGTFGVVPLEAPAKGIQQTETMKTDDGRVAEVRVAMFTKAEKSEHPEVPLA